MTDVGRTRSENQDAFGAFRREDGARLMVVADGMGGHRGGATASRLCIEVMGRVFAQYSSKPEECLREGMIAANREVRQAAELDPELAGMGTTAVAVLFETDGEAFVAWVGDSRAYLLRGDHFSALTEDHSLVSMWVRQGILTPEQAEGHPRRNELLRAIGVLDALEVDVVQYDPQSEDRLVLCSDGLCGVVSDSVIKTGVGVLEPEEAARELIASANIVGGPDNITVQVIAIPMLPPSANATGGGGAWRPIAFGLLLVATGIAALSFAGYL